MNTSISRRKFFHQTSFAGAGALMLGASRSHAALSPGDKIVVGVMGLGRGMDHVRALMTIPNAEIAYVCDVDQQRVDKAAAAVSDKQNRAPKGVQDFHRMLDDRDVEAIFIATPNHWHAPATILACAAGKHVYVEKPGSHNAREGELMVAAARKHKRVVQMGNQRRSFPAMIEAVEKMRAGVIGKVLYARTSYNNARGSIGHGKQVPPPASLDYSMWQGPAPERPYVDNLVHYNWHWRWHWGGGELTNNGIHALDVARWGLGVEYPQRVSFSGGRYHFKDDQETPDTGAAVFDFGGSGISWDCSSCIPRSHEKVPFVAFYGEGGVLANEKNGYAIYDPKGKEIERKDGPGGDKIHIQNFLDCIRSGKRPNSEIEEGQKSTLLCHLGNIAYRTGHTLHIDQRTGKIIDDRDAQKLWSREYRKGWEPKV
ncbi:MAG TPA: Gfo/Idh/MocA family oxidoreductase [Verrucomicrobiae bacterium]|nr:Gfo/Idh/MocA family oxidoreductase [Verrucomicrobiae bacterium]